MEELKQLQVKLGPNKVEISDALVMYISTNSSDVKHCWFSGRILPCHAGDRGSIPRQCRIFKLLQNVQIRGFYTTSEKCQRCKDKYIHDGILIAL